MNQRYAMIDRNGSVRRVTTGDKPHEDALPVEYPELTETSTTHYIQQKNPEQWDVKSDKVVVTYQIIPKDLRQEKQNLKKLVKQVRGRVIRQGITVTLNGNDITIPLDEVTIARVDQAALDAERRPTDWKKRWKISDGFWTDLNSDQIEAIRSAGADHIEAAFANEEQVNNAIDQAQTLEELANVDLNSGWPGG